MKPALGWLVVALAIALAVEYPYHVAAVLLAGGALVLVQRRVNP